MHRLGVFALSVERVLFSDVKMFLTFLLLQVSDASYTLLYPLIAVD